MKPAPLILFLAFLSMMLHAQSRFSPADYMEFIASNKSLEASELLEMYPPQSIYYSSRIHPAELEKIPWFDTVSTVFELTADEKEMLKQNYFVATERIRSLSWIDAYINLYGRDIPLFLSTDFILHTLHQSYDEILKQLEVQVLEPNLKELLRALYEYFPLIYSSYTGEEALSLSLQDVDLFIAVARSLLENEEWLPQFSERTEYDAVMAGIASEEMTYMPLFTREDLKRKLDFSQFKPRGHYTDIVWTQEGSRTLENYFRAMMWLGRIDFLLTAPPENPWEADWLQEDLLRMNLSALLLNENLHICGKKDLLDKHEAIISFMVGPDDNMTPDELKELYDNNLESITDLLVEDEFENFKVLINSSDDYGQKIMSNFFLVDPNTEDPGKLPVSYKVLGQKFLIDSYIFSELVFDRIIFEGEKIWRPLPDPLDIMSVFGNEDAMALMEQEMTEFKYAYKINQLKYLVDSYDDAFWSQSMYNSWLSAILELNPLPDATGLPFFMRTTAWHHEKLNTQLTSWAQLRHDNILYGKQSYTGGTGCSYPYTYVEPYPEFYSQLNEFAVSASSFFDEVLPAENEDLRTKILDFYSGYAEIMTKLETISKKELNREALDESELIFLKTMINDFMASGPSVSGWVNDLLFPSMDRYECDFTVADVHTQPTTKSGAVVGNVLHVGNGLINFGFFLAPNTAQPSQYICYAGPLSAFHTEVTSQFYRLDDDEWRDMFYGGMNPERPDWVYAYLANSKGEQQASERLLKGQVYTETEIQLNEPDLAYLLAFPNPASEEIHFRFILNELSIVNADVFDLSGRCIKKLYSGQLPAGEHDLEMYFDRAEAGLYFLRLNINGSLSEKRFVVK